MEILAFTYLAVDYESDITVAEHQPVRMSLPRCPNLDWMTVAALTLSFSTFMGSASAIALVRQGDMGDQVSALQTSLQKLGYPVGTVDGIFGTGTQNALIRFQQQQGLTVDGIAGAQTFAKLAELEGKSTSSSGTGGGELLTLGTSSSAVTNLQTKLRDLGFFPLDVEISGYYGPVTVDAVRAFQRSHNLVADGIAGPATQSALFATQPTVHTPVPSPVATAPTPTSPTTPDATTSETTTSETTTPDTTVPETTPPETSSPEIAPLNQGDSGSAVTALQEKLRQLNYFDIVPTGYYGPVTTEAVRAFQQTNGLSVDGIAGPATLAKLSNGGIPANPNSVADGSSPSEEATAVEVSNSVANTPSSLANGRVVTVRATNGLRIRTAPNADATVAGVLLDGTSVEVTGEVVGDWLEIAPSGWIHQAYVSR